MAVSISDFERAARMLNQTLEAGRVRVVILVPFGSDYVRFVYDPDDEVFIGLLAEASLELRSFQQAVGDISETLTAVIEDAESNFVRARSEGSPSGRRERVEDAETARRKFGLAKDLFQVDDLRRRAWIKRTSKTAVPIKIEWELAAKHSDDDDPAPSGAPVPYATVVFRGNLPDPAHLLFRASERLSLTMDMQDVEVALSILTRLRDAFRRMESE